MALTACPLEYVTDDVWQMLDAADLLEKGLPPVHGGSLDQTRVFIDAARFAWSERDRWRAQLGLGPGR